MVDIKVDIAGGGMGIESMTASPKITSMRGDHLVVNPIFLAL